MARIDYNRNTAEAYRAAREIPRAGLDEWREAARRHLRPSVGMTVLDLGAGTGQFSTALVDWFDVEVIAVEPSAAMREQIPDNRSIRVLAGDAMAIPLPDESADAAWLSLMIHHVPDLAAAAREIRRVLRPDSPVLIRQGYPGRLDGVENVRWFPETARAVADYPTLDATRDAFAGAGFEQVALERVRETYPGTLSDLLDQVDTLRRADTTMRVLTDDEFERGKERIRRAIESGDEQVRSNTLELLVLR
jgi:ubiquinone/menaquinone biosynthesis C-methylase UbiE